MGVLGEQGAAEHHHGAEGDDAERRPLPSSIPGSAFLSQLEQDVFNGVPVLTGFHLLPPQVEMSQLPPRSQETRETGNFYR